MEKGNNDFLQTKTTECAFEENMTEYSLESFRCFSNYTEIKKPEQKRLSKPAFILFLCCVILLFAFASFCIVSEVFNLNSGFYSPETNTTVILGQNSKPVDDQYTDESGRYTTIGIARHVGPSIIEILTYSDITHSTIVGSGSGIIVSNTGYIVTNAHVINSAKYLAVYLSDKSVYDAEIIGYDSKTDIAVIKINADSDKLYVAEFGNSDDVVQGEQVIAIGNPGGLTGSISGGYVSGINRMIKADKTGYEMNCIQTDAAISPGNSGGALVNMYGQVIGITSSKYVSSSYEGLGFAISINEAKPIIEELIAKGHVSGRFRIGIEFYTVTKEISESSGVPVGLMIGSIAPECDISNSGLMVNDIIVEAEGKAVYDYDSLLKAIGEKKAGDTVTAKIIRIDENKKEEKLEINFKLMPDTSGNF